MALVGLLTSVDADVPRDLLPVLGGVLTVRALVHAGAPMALHVLVKHKLVPAGKVAEGAVQGFVLGGSRLVALHVMPHQLLPLLGCKAAQLTAVAEMLRLVLLQCLPGGEGLLAGAALQVRVLLLHVALERGLTVTHEVAAWAAVGNLFLMPPQDVLLEGRLRTEPSLTAGAAEVELAMVAAVNVAGDVILEVAAVVTERAEVGGCLLMHPQAVDAQLGVGAEGLAADAAGDAPHAGVQGLVGLQAVASRGAELAVAALVRLHPLVLDADVLPQAPGLLAGELALAALQLWPLAVVLAVQPAVQPQGFGHLGGEGAGGAAKLTQGHAAPLLVRLHGPFLVAGEGASGAGETPPLGQGGFWWGCIQWEVAGLVFLNTGWVPLREFGPLGFILLGMHDVLFSTVALEGPPGAEGLRAQGAPELLQVPAAILHMGGDGGDTGAHKGAGIAVQLPSLQSVFL